MPNSDVNSGETTATIGLLIERADERRVRHLLRPLGFARVPSPRVTTGLFFAGYDPLTARWIRIEVMVRGGSSQGGLFGPLSRITQLLARFVPVRRGLSVALLGPDGAGKSTLAEGIARSFYFPVRLLYMGLWQGGKAPPRLPFPVPGFELAALLLRAWRPYVVSRYHQARGRLVIFDRYTYDALLTTPASSDKRARLYHWVLGHACPAPDLVLVLDVPGQVMYQRKGEHSPEQLERQRQRFLALSKQIPRAVVLDGTRPAEQVCNSALARIWLRYTRRD